MLQSVFRDEEQNAEKTEVMIFVFQMRCTPNEEFINETSYFHFSVGQNNIDDVIICLK